MLRDGHGDTHDVSFLEGVGADELGPDLAGNEDDGLGIHVSIRNRGDQVGCTGPGSGDGDTGFAGG